MQGMGIWIVVAPNTRDITAAITSLTAAGATVAEVELPLYSAPSGADVRLTRRQREVMALVAHGLSNKQIAAMLHLAPSTIANTVSDLLTQTGARNRAGLASLAASAGIVE